MHVHLKSVALNFSLNLRTASCVGRDYIQNLARRDMLFNFLKHSDYYGTFRSVSFSDSLVFYLLHVVSWSQFLNAVDLYLGGVWISAGTAAILTGFYTVFQSFQPNTKICHIPYVLCLVCMDHKCIIKLEPQFQGMFLAQLMPHTILEENLITERKMSRCSYTLSHIHCVS